MGKYLEVARAVARPQPGSGYEINEINEKTRLAVPDNPAHRHNPSEDGRIGPAVDRVHPDYEINEINEKTPPPADPWPAMTTAAGRVDKRLGFILDTMHRFGAEAGPVAVDAMTVHHDLQGVGNPTPSAVTDGKSYPATKPKSNGREGTRWGT